MFPASHRPRAAAAAGRALRVVVPVAMGAVTWVVLLLALGVVARIDSVLGLLALFVVALMLWPLLVFRPWRDGVTERLGEWARRHRYVLAVTAVLAGVTVSPFLPDVARPVVGVLRLPYRNVAGVLYGTSLFYRDRVGAAFGTALFRAGQWYLELLWLYAIASGTVALFRWVGDR